MPEMKDSGIEWVGLCPNHWGIMANKYIMKKIKVINPVYKGEDILSLTMNGVIVRDLDAGGKMPASFDGYQVLYPGNLLMCLFDYDVTPRCIGLIKDEGVSSPAYSQFVLKNGNDAKYYYYYYLMIDNTKELLHLAKNLRHSFTEEQLGSINAPVPPMEEQMKIAAFLDKVCGEIDTLSVDIQAEIDTLEEYKRSVITEAVTKGLNTDVELVDTGHTFIPYVPINWEFTKAGRLFVEDVRSAVGSEQPLSLSQKDGLVKTEDMVEHSMKSKTYSGWKKVRKNDLVLNRFKAHLGVFFCSKYDGMVSFHYGVYAPKYDLNVKFYEYLFHSKPYCDMYAELSNGITVGLQNLSNANFYAGKCVRPPKQEQDRIVEYLDEKCKQIEKTISMKQEQLTILEEYKKSVIYEYVTGKKEVV